MLESTHSYIGQWHFNYWPAKKKKSLLTIREDGSAVTSNGTWYQWNITDKGNIILFIEGYVSYNGSLKNDIISGLAFSDYSGQKWEWNAQRYIKPIETPIHKEDLFNGYWTLRNDIEGIEDNVVKFSEDGKFISKNYPVGQWFLSSKCLEMITANGFLKYKAKCIDGTISGRCRNQVGIEWTFRLEHTTISISSSSIPKTKPAHKPIELKPETFTQTKKVDYVQILNYLRENGIHFFYHFTAQKNIPSIKEKKGLYSWKYLLDHGISIPDAGGDEWSRELDLKEGLEDYVRLSFCIDHPMKNRKRDSNPVLLKIDIEVAALEYTLFSNMNAASPKHCHGGAFDDLKKVDIKAVKKTFVSRTDPDFQKHQAEVMVKTSVPIRYILNINQF